VLVTASSLVAGEPRLVTSAVTIADVANRSMSRAEGMLDALASRAVIEQAKGSIMTVLQCSADQAWTVLRRASQEFNVKLRELASALVEHIGHAPALDPESPDHSIVAGSVARHAAELVWQALTMPADGARPRGAEEPGDDALRQIVHPAGTAQAEPRTP
jgi:hypothetical protein